MLAFFHPLIGKAASCVFFPGAGAGFLVTGAPIDSLGCRLLLVVLSAATVVTADEAEFVFLVKAVSSAWLGCRR